MAVKMNGYNPVTVPLLFRRTFAPWLSLPNSITLIFLPTNSFFSAASLICSIFMFCTPTFATLRAMIALPGILRCGNVPNLTADIAGYYSFICWRSTRQPGWHFLSLPFLLLLVKKGIQENQNHFRCDCHENACYKWIYIHLQHLANRLHKFRIAQISHKAAQNPKALLSSSMQLNVHITKSENCNAIVMIFITIIPFHPFLKFSFRYRQPHKTR